MGLLDFLFGNKKEKERQEREFQAEQTRLRLEQERKIADERERRLAENRRKTSEYKANNEISTNDEADYSLLVFHANWCGASKRFLNELKDTGLKFKTIDVDQDEKMVSKYRVRSIPYTILVNKSGDVIQKWVGYDDEDPGQKKIISFIKNGNYGLLGKTLQKGAEFEMPSSKKQQLPEGIEIDDRCQFFELKDIKSIKMGSDMVLAPYDSLWFSEVLDGDVAILTAFANTERIRKFLPGLDFSTPDKAKKKLESFLLMPEAQAGVCYVIRSQNFPAGMIIVHTPLFNKAVGVKLPIFTLDFFITEMMEHKRIMFNALLRVLNVMKLSMGAKKVYALVDRSNSSCINLIGKGLFTQIDNAGFVTQGADGEKPLVYMIDLERIRFEKR